MCTYIRHAERLTSVFIRMIFLKIWHSGSSFGSKIRYFGMLLSKNYLAVVHVCARVY